MWLTLRTYCYECVYTFLFLYASSRWTAFGEADLAAEIVMFGLCERLGESICRLISRGYMWDSYFAGLYLVLFICREIGCSYVITVDCRCVCCRNLHFIDQGHQPTNLSSCRGNRPVLSFSRRTGNCGLFLRWPCDGMLPIVDYVCASRCVIITIPSSICICIGM